MTSRSRPSPPSHRVDPRRRRARRLLVGFLIVANVVVFGSLAVVWLAANQVTAALSTIPFEELDLTREPAGVSQARTFLLVGSDSRASLDDLTNFGDVAGERADVVILAQVLPGEGRLQLLSLPRDLKVAWEGGVDKINATFAYGGPAGILAAVKSHTGLPVHHYIQVDFAGFSGIVDAVGGIEMTFPFPARDLKSGFEVAAGTQTLDGMQAVALARSRRYEELREGSWISIDANDLGRTRRQQDLLLAIITQIDRPSSIGGYRDLLDALGGFVTIDNALDADDIIQLAWELRSVDAASLDSATLPVKEISEGGVSYVTELQPQAADMLAAFAAGDLLTSTSDRIRIEVENGNGRSGSASLMADTLSSLGFEVVAEINSGRSDYPRTLVISRPSMLDLAQSVADALGYGEATIGRIPAGADLVVIVGADAPFP